MESDSAYYTRLRVIIREQCILTGGLYLTITEQMVEFYVPSVIDLNACLFFADVYDRVTERLHDWMNHLNSPIIVAGISNNLNIKHACLDDFVFFLLTIVVSEDSRQLCSISVLTLNFTTVRQHHNVCL